jgi:preprotein translocase subunit YajC
VLREGEAMKHRLTLRRSSMLRYVMLVMMVAMMVLVRSLRKRRVRHQQTHARG